MAHKEKQHHPVIERYQNYLGEFVYGGIDGSVTTFAVVAGSVGAGLDSAVIIILGFANLLADGFSMSIGAYLSSRSEQLNLIKHKKRQELAIQKKPKIERGRLGNKMDQRGVAKANQERILDVLEQNPEIWVDTLLVTEKGISQQGKSPLKVGLATYVSFVLIGLIPLVVYVWDYIGNFPGNTFFWASSLTGMGFLIIGYLKSYVTESSSIKGMVETLSLGVIAAGVAYFVGDLLEKMIL
jgi:VIT1/CCC1 family predicted Fe2+/Mn2+ transporter